MPSPHRHEVAAPRHNRGFASTTEKRPALALPRSISAAFQAKYLARDIQAGIITGAMTIPLSLGIVLMSDYPIKVGLATVAFACFIGWVSAFVRPGNFVGVPGIAAGLSPVLAIGVARFGIENMAFVIFLTSTIQAVIWKFNWQRYILLAVPGYLVEGLLAGVGLKIALKFLTFTYEIPADQESAEAFWSGARLQIMLISLAGFAMFVYLFSKFKETQPAIPYFLLIGASIAVAQLLRLGEARETIESWRRDYNEVRPHTSLGNRTPQEFTARGAALRSPTAPFELHRREEQKQEITPELAL